MESSELSIQLLEDNYMCKVWSELSTITVVLYYNFVPSHKSELCYNEPDQFQSDVKV